MAMGTNTHTLIPWHKPWAESVWLGCSVWPLCRRSQERSPEPNSDTLHLSVGEKQKKPNKSESHVDTHNQQKSSISITLCNVKQNSYPYKTLSTTRRSLQYPTIKSLQNTNTFVHISAARYANMYVVCLSLMKEAVCELMLAMFLSPILTGDPLYRTLPQETHNHAS